jgi:hypothetical protein
MALMKHRWLQVCKWTVRVYWSTQAQDQQRFCRAWLILSAWT